MERAHTQRRTKALSPGQQLSGAQQCSGTFDWSPYCDDLVPPPPIEKSRIGVGPPTKDGQQQALLDDDDEEEDGERDDASSGAEERRQTRCTSTLCAWVKLWGRKFIPGYTPLLMSLTILVVSLFLPLRHFSERDRDVHILPYALYAAVSIGIFCVCLLLRVIWLGTIAPSITESRVAVALNAVLDPELIYVVATVHICLFWAYIPATQLNQDLDSVGSRVIGYMPLDDFRILLRVNLLLILWAARNLCLSVCVFYFLTGFLMALNSCLVKYLRVYRVIRRLNANWVRLSLATGAVRRLSSDGSSRSSLFRSRKPTPQRTPQRWRTKMRQGGHSLLPARYKHLGFEHVATGEKTDAIRRHIAAKDALHNEKGNMFQLPSVLHRRHIAKTQTNAVANLLALEYCRQYPPSVFSEGIRIRFMHKKDARVYAEELFKELAVMRNAVVPPNLPSDEADEAVVRIIGVAYRIAMRGGSIDLGNVAGNIDPSCAIGHVELRRGPTVVQQQSWTAGLAGDTSPVAQPSAAHSLGGNQVKYLPPPALAVPTPMRASGHGTQASKPTRGADGEEGSKQGWSESAGGTPSNARKQKQRDHLELAVIPEGSENNTPRTPHQLFEQHQSHSALPPTNQFDRLGRDWSSPLSDIEEDEGNPSDEPVTSLELLRGSWSRAMPAPCPSSGDEEVWDRAVMQKELEQFLEEKIEEDEAGAARHSAPFFPEDTEEGNAETGGPRARPQALYGAPLVDVGGLLHASGKESNTGITDFGNVLFSREFFEIFLDRDTDCFMEFADPGGRGSVSARNFRRVFFELYNTRKQLLYLVSSQESMRKIVSRLISTFLAFLTILIFLFITGVSVDTIIISGAAVLSSCTVILSFLYTGFVQALIFVCFLNPYNVNDRVVIDTDLRIVKKVHTYYTEFFTVHGKIETINHSALFTKPLTNESRCKNGGIELPLLVQFSTPQSKCDALNYQIERFVQEHPDYVKDSFHCFIDSFVVGDYKKLVYWFSAVDGWGDFRSVWNSRALVVRYIAKQCQLLGITYRLPQQPVLPTHKLSEVLK